MEHAPFLNHGWLEVITGCMFSGKTTKLIGCLEICRIAQQKLYLFKPTKDDRDSTTATVTHYGREWPIKLINPGAETLSTLADLIGQEELEKADVIGFDEANFFSKLFIDLCEQLVGENMNKRVIVAGLDQTFAGNPYGPMADIMAIADDVSKLHAVCVVCKGLATKTQRLINGEPATKDSPQDIVGGSKAKPTDQGIVTYEARCRACHKIVK